MVLLIQLKGQLYRESGHLDPDSGSATDWIWRLSRPGPLCCLMAVQRGRDPRALELGPLPPRPAHSCSSSMGPRLLGCLFFSIGLTYFTSCSFSIQNSFCTQQNVMAIPLYVGWGVPGQLCFEGSGHCRDTAGRAHNNSWHLLSAYCVPSTVLKTLTVLADLTHRIPVKYV